jgi:hypothetical protein
MSKRINIVLPDKTLAILDRVATKGKRSQFISRAVLHFIESQGVSGEFRGQATKPLNPRSSGCPVFPSAGSRIMG